MMFGEEIVQPGLYFFDFYQEINGFQSRSWAKTLKRSLRPPETQIGEAHRSF